MNKTFTPVHCFFFNHQFITRGAKTDRELTRESLALMGLEYLLVDLLKRAPEQMSMPS